MRELKLPDELIEVARNEAKARRKSVGEVLLESVFRAAAKAGVSKAELSEAPLPPGTIHMQVDSALRMVHLAAASGDRNADGELSAADLAECDPDSVTRDRAVRLEIHAAAARGESLSYVDALARLEFAESAAEPPAEFAGANQGSVALHLAAAKEIAAAKEKGETLSYLEAVRNVEIAKRGG